jgi:hypothetical protein
MVFTFADLGIDLADFQGVEIGMLRKHIINEAANALTLSWWDHPCTAVEALYDWPNASVNFYRYRVEIPPMPSEVWEQIAL